MPNGQSIYMRKWSGHISGLAGVYIKQGCLGLVRSFHVLNGCMSNSCAHKNSTRNGGKSRNSNCIPSY